MIENLYEGGGGVATPATHGSECKPIGEGEEIEFLYEGRGEVQPHLFLIGLNADLMGRVKVIENLYEEGGGGEGSYTCHPWV